ncbi:MAG: hypothetical protein FJ030_17760 [Chloroflexi bacterium]|nr:hypothetical protein [Chloroflexota bacterium]
MATGIRGEFQRARTGQTITVNHPQRGAITGKILGTIRYTELWQRVKSPSEPWSPTGNGYTAHWLGNFMVYEWKESVWLLDEYNALTDKDIATHFAPYAKRFGESNETADVYFAFPPASWKITDIGKFSVQSAEGAGLRLNTGATGRFIHASGDGGRALVVEDYQSGSGGQDTAWIGYSITWDDVKKIALGRFANRPNRRRHAAKPFPNRQCCNSCFGARHRAGNHVPARAHRLERLHGHTASGHRPDRFLGAHLRHLFSRLRLSHAETAGVRVAGGDSQRVGGAEQPHPGHYFCGHAHRQHSVPHAGYQAVAPRFYSPFTERHWRNCPACR